MSSLEQFGGALLDIPLPQASSSMDTHDPNILILNVGGRIFRLYTWTLAPARYFKDNFEQGWPKEEDGSVFIDTDPNTFEHVLRYLRRPSLYPLFWTKAHGFDYDLYNRLEDAARLFKIDKLENWIKEKKYLQAIVQESSVHVQRIDDDNGYARLRTVGSAGIADVERQFIPRVERVYVCPRKIFVHRGNPDACGQACEKARGDRSFEYVEETYMEVVTIHKKYVVDTAICMEEL